MAGQDKKKARKAGRAKDEAGSVISMCSPTQVASLTQYEMEDANDTKIAADPRFANIQNDPRYRLPGKRQTHVKLDKRFAHMLDDKDFSRNAAVDRYGRKLAKDDTKQQLKKFYRIEDEDEGEGEDEDEISADDDEEVRKELKRVERRDYDPARDGGFTSSSDDDSSSEEDEAEVEEDEVEFPDQQQTDIPMGEVTKRIAVVNLDWDNIRAQDLMAVFSSFLPTGGKVSKVAVYPSEFGRERMEKEEVEGPPKEIFASQKEDAINDEDEEDEEDEEDLGSDEEEEEIKKSMLKADEGEEFNSTALRRYQLERLRYFYAVLTFSSKDAAKHVYDLVDGAEYLSSANFFDLRFVPDDTDFDDDKPRDQCSRLPDGYKPNEFVTDALQHSKVKLTWDADDKSRKEAQARAFRGSRQDIDENDLKAYLGSDSSESEDDEEGGVEVVDNTTDETTSKKLSKREAEKQRMRALLGLSTEPTRSSKPAGPVGDMEVTFTSGLAGGHGKNTIYENEPEIEESTIDKYVRKERERKKRRKEKLQGNQQGEDEESKDTEPAINSQEEAQDDEDMGFNDPFFDDPDGKATSAARRKEEKRKKREERAAEEAASAAQRAELELLMVDDKKAGVNHFDMNEIEKAEKQARRKKGKGKGKGKETTVTDDFNVDVSDPRFARLYESHEFAIDPTNPRFKSTSGMKALLDEGRKRRRNRDEGDAEPVAEIRERPKKQKKAAKETGSEDLKRLVDKVKRQSTA
ncbi:hypothetical protein N7492_003079 [Penicillium capsulatum]|uniref:NUC153 domain-containing protein n=1 Tax=Penicillium capsulatum TaxID=69766 RepID=A0A9W9IL93_9EURO|nr:hypothetical protein N7492_003079 [Penicillium capsulatum]KAJ6122329.1 hypothetical protein N7512_004794 [Penicillium capsulatum]